MLRVYSVLFGCGAVLTDFHKSLRLYRAVAGVSLLTCAAVYVTAGLLCLGRLKRARSRREAERAKVTGEMAALEAKRRELEGLLATYATD
ncbi:hypothetical protein WJX81_001223 [Elliptochloris bilobata]|uniref:Uncharacterized protein n=1 Tax=Elliptochloris bilobata TaxID=381761 RepID=A0AAW1RCD2_9CHLO